MSKRSSPRVAFISSYVPRKCGIATFAHDLATAHLKALDHLVAGGESQTLNCGYGRGHSVREVLASVERAAGTTLDKRAAPRRAGDPPALVSNADRLRARFDWTPEHDDLDVITATALAWERHRRG